MQIGLVGLGRMGANMSRRFWAPATLSSATRVKARRWTGCSPTGRSLPAPVLTTALHQPFTSRGEADFADRVLSAVRSGFGGHVEGKG